MKKMSYLSMTGLVLLLQISVHAQTDSLKEKTQFKLGVYYSSHLHYYGRTDSLRSSGVFPLAELWFGENFYINAAPVFVNNAVDRFNYAGTIATAGYQFNDHKRWAGNLYLVKPFYQRNTTLVQSALKAQFTGTLTLQNKILNLTAGGDIKLSDDVDFGAQAAADHLFRFELPRKCLLVMDPSATVNAGTRQFTRTYYKKNNLPFLPATGQEIAQSGKEFKVLSYELAVPVIFVKGKFQLIFIPSYVLPQHLTASEHGTDLLYATAGLKVIF